MASYVDISRFQVSPHQSVDLTEWPTRIDRLYDSKADYLRRLGEYRSEISQLQTVLYAHNRYAMLLIFQGMDTAGKGGAIKHVMSGINPQGCQVHCFGPPSQQELGHDFLWRTNQRLPERGRIGIFDRSYYEEVLVVRVRPEVLAKVSGRASYVQYVERITTCRLGYEINRNRMGIVFIAWVNNSLITHDV